MPPEEPKEVDGTLGVKSLIRACELVHMRLELSIPPDHFTKPNHLCEACWIATHVVMTYLNLKVVRIVAEDEDTTK